MTKQTNTKFRRLYDLQRNTSSTNKTKDGHIALLDPVKREVPLPAEPRKVRKISCGRATITVMVSEGQIINERKACKKAGY